MIAGQPTRISPAVDLEDGVQYRGFVKLRLGHGHHGSLIVPDQIFVKAGPWRFLQPSFFGSSIMSLNIEPDLNSVEFSVDVGPPRANRLTRLLVRIRSDARVRSYPDGSQLYACEVLGPKFLPHYASGRCRLLNDGEFVLALYHHTNANALTSIKASRELWSSNWNLQGTRRLENVAYVYLTSLPAIAHSEDLARIAMASSGKIAFQTTSDRAAELALELTVYRENTTGRTSTIEVDVPSMLLAPPHLLFHPFVPGNPAYYEVVAPEVFRIGVLPRVKVPIPRGLASPAAHDLKAFDYIVLGDASELQGLAAPYTEEETKHIMHHQRFEADGDLFAFWFANANSDQFTDRVFEARHVQPADG